MGEKLESITGLPEKEILIGLLKKTIEKSWKIDMEIDIIEEWLKNFNGEVYGIEDERILALWLLCNYTFYNKEDVRHLCKTLYHSFIHQLLVDFLPQTDQDIESLISNVKYSAIGLASQSGNYLLYDFRYEAGLKTKDFYFPTTINSDSNTIVAFLDDVLLSGDTALKFFERNLKGIKAKKIYYLSLFATEKAIQRLEKENIHVVYCGLLNDRDRSFSDKSLLFTKYEELLEPSKRVAFHYGQKLQQYNPLGHGDGQFRFGFYYNTPNNTLPIFWSSAKGWKPIFERRGGKNNVKNQSRYYI